ncbi:MAG: hypothetical protein AAFX79_02170 [Planctomycetota bacterium]
MSSLLDGIDVAGSGGSSGGGGGVDPKVIKIGIAAAIFVVAGVVIAMQLNIIPSPFGSSGPKDSSGNTVRYVPPTEEEKREELQRIEEQQQSYIEQGYEVGGS